MPFTRTMSKEFTLNIEVMLWYVLAFFFLWISLASVVGVKRLSFQPLVLSALGALLMAISSLGRAIDVHARNGGSWIGLCQALGLICLSIFGLAYKARLSTYKVTMRDLLL